jgi:anti-anti-sigma factor
VLVADRAIQHGGIDPSEGGHVPTLTPLLQVQIRQDAERTVVSVCGEVDLVTVADLEEALCEVCLSARGPVELDLAGVTFLSCRGLAALASSRDTLAARRHALVLRGPRSAVRRVLELTDLRGACR